MNATGFIIIVDAINNKWLHRTQFVIYIVVCVAVAAAAAAVLPLLNAFSFIFYIIFFLSTCKIIVTIRYCFYSTYVWHLWCGGVKRWFHYLVDFYRNLFRHFSFSISFDFNAMNFTVARFQLHRFMQFYYQLLCFGNDTKCSPS